MEIYNTGETRDEYFQTQIKRSRTKFHYCKVSYFHVKKWKGIIEKREQITGPILCLGTRNCREVDMFRTVFNSGRLLNFLVKSFEINRAGYNSIFPVFESFRRSSIQKITENSIVGVEINPDAKRQDVLIGTFDELPEEWENLFGLIYSNSFDQSQEPHKTAKEWLRVLKNDSIIILGFSEDDPNATDPVGKLSYKDFVDLFPGELLFFQKSSSRYHDVIIKIKK